MLQADKTRPDARASRNGSEIASFTPALRHLGFLLLVLTTGCSQDPDVLKSQIPEAW